MEKLNKQELELERKRHRAELEKLNKEIEEKKAENDRLSEQMKSLTEKTKGAKADSAAMDKLNKQIAFLKRKIENLQEELARLKLEYEDMEVKATTAMWRLRMNRVDFDKLRRENDKVCYEMEKCKIKMEKARRGNSTKKMLA